MMSTGLHNKNLTLRLIVVCHGSTCIYLGTVSTILVTQPRLLVLRNHTIFLQFPLGSSLLSISHHGNSRNRNLYFGFPIWIQNLKNWHAKNDQAGVPWWFSRLKIQCWSSRCGTGEMNWLGTMRLQAGSLASLSGLRIQCCCELWCRSQTWLRSRVAVALE